MYQYEDYIKTSQRSITALKTLGQTEQQQKLRNKYGKKNNFMNISSDRLVKYHTRIPRHDY